MTAVRNVAGRRCLTAFSPGGPQIDITVIIGALPGQAELATRSDGIEPPAVHVDVEVVAPVALPSRRTADGAVVADRGQVPARVYVVGRSGDGRRTMTACLQAIASGVSGGSADIDTLPWASLRFSHTTAIRAALARAVSEGRYAPATATAKPSDRSCGGAPWPPASPPSPRRPSPHLRRRPPRCRRRPARRPATARTRLPGHLLALCDRSGDRARRAAAERLSLEAGPRATAGTRQHQPR